MSFTSVLAELRARVGCTNAQLSAASGLSPAVLSRYANGVRTPTPEGDFLRNLARGFARVAAENDLQETFTEASVLAELQQALREPEATIEAFCRRLDETLACLNIANKDVAAQAQVDPSYISRVRVAKRSPAHPELLARATAKLAAAKALSSQEAAYALRELLACGGAALPEGDMGVEDEVFAWLMSAAQTAHTTPSCVKEFLAALDAFDSNDYLTALRAGAIQLPTHTLQKPLTHTYTGLHEMRQGELDFLNLVAVNPASTEVIMYSDLPSQALTQDAEWARLWARGVGAIIARGVQLHLIQNVNRPLPSLLEGLRAWVPLYATGQVQPWYLRGETSRVFSRLTFASNVAALSGETVLNHTPEGRLQLSTHSADINFHLTKMHHVLEAATPLMEVYAEDNPAQQAAFKAAEAARAAQQTPRRVARGAFKTLQLTAYSGDCVVIVKQARVGTHFVVRHPRLREELEHFNP